MAQAAPEQHLRPETPQQSQICGLEGSMTEEIDKAVFRKYEIQTKLGKGVSG